MEEPGKRTEAGRTILLAEDDGAIRALARRTLEAAGYRVLEAGDGDQALDISNAWTGDIDLLVTDVRMEPGMEGFQLAQCLRLMRVEVRVLYVSGYVEHEMVRWEIECGMAHFLRKPFTAAELLEAIRKCWEPPA